MLIEQFGFAFNVHIMWIVLLHKTHFKTKYLSNVTFLKNIIDSSKNEEKDRGRKK